MQKNFKMYLGIIFLLIILNFFPFQLKSDKLDKLNPYVEYELVKSSGFWNLTGSSIFIDDSDPSCNWSKTANDYLWCYGSGTWNDPFTIENVTIDAQNLNNCIEIRNSQSSYFIIKNCSLTKSSMIYRDGGIKLYNSSKGTIFNNTCSLNMDGISLERSDNNTINHNILTFNDGVGIRIYGGSNNSLMNNKIKNNAYPIILDQAIAECRSNEISNNELGNGGIDLINGCEENIVDNNTITNGGDAFDLYKAYHNNFTNNVISGMNNQALNLEYCEYNKFINNTWKNCYPGITFERFDNNNDFINNTFINIENAAITLGGIPGFINLNNTFQGNKFYNCGMRIDFTPEEAVTTTMWIATTMV